MSTTPITRSERLLYSRSEAAALLGIHPRTLDKLVDEKKLKAKYVGDRPLISRRELERFAGTA